MKLFVALVIAARSLATAVLQTVDFDNLPSESLNNTVAPLRLYNGLYWKSIGVSYLTGKSNIAAHSGRNAASYGEYTKMTGLTYVTTNFTGSQYRSFDLEGFYWACAAGLPGTPTSALSPVDCDLKMGGYIEGYPEFVYWRNIEYGYAPASSSERPASMVKYTPFRDSTGVQGNLFRNTTKLLFATTYKFPGYPRGQLPPGVKGVTMLDDFQYILNKFI